MAGRDREFLSVGRRFLRLCEHDVAEPTGCSAYEGCQAGRGFSAWCFSLRLGRARRSGREAESRAVAPRPMNRSDSELASRLLVCVSFF